jgi:hypothetical protein
LENKLSQEDKEICDEGITLDEISKAVKLQKPDKSPEGMGLLVNFTDIIGILLEKILSLW